MSISNVGTKKEVGTEAMRSRNLIQSISDMRHGVTPVLHIRVVSCNTVMQRDFIFFAVEKSWFTPTELVHLFRERILSENLSNAAVSLTGETLGIQKTHGADQIQ